MTNDKLIKKSICLFCSLGCGVAFRTSGGHVLAIDYDKENPVNRGSLCPRGNYNFELLNHPRRLVEPQLGQRRISWSEALSFLGHRLKEFAPDSAGIILSSLSSNEDAYLAARLAKVLGIRNIAAAGGPAGVGAYQGYTGKVEGAEPARLDDIENSEALLIIGDILTRSPVLSKRINRVKYGKRGNKIIVVDPNRTHTSWFATTHLANRPGTEALLLAAMARVMAQEKGKGTVSIDLAKASKAVGIPQDLIAKAAQDFSRALSGTVIFVPSANKERNDLIGYLVKLLASLSPGKRYISFFEGGNTLGVNTILDQMLEEHTSYAELIKKIENGGVKALLMLGEDISQSSPELEKKMRKLKFIAMSNYFKTDLVDEAVLVLPLASHLETGATYTLADGRLEEPEGIAPKVGARSNLEIIACLLNLEPDLKKIRQETKEILSKGAPQRKVDLKEKLSETQKIVAKERVPLEDITHFGNNGLVKNFFWFRVNNKIG